MKENSPPSQSPGSPTGEPIEELSGAEKLVDSLRPYGSMIALGVALLFLVFIAIAWLIKSNLDQSENQWRLLNTKIAEFSLTQNTTGLREVAEEYPSGKAGLWGLQLAGDIDLRSGIGQLGENQAEGTKMIERARDTLQKIVDAPAAEKTTMLQQRSTFSLAYAEESLGNFDAANTMYQQLVDANSDGAFGNAAQRGLDRLANPSLVSLYDTFKNWEDPLAMAPGVVIPDRPDISFPKIDLPKSPAPEVPKTPEIPETSKTPVDSAAPETAENDAADSEEIPSADQVMDSAEETATVDASSDEALVEGGESVEGANTEPSNEDGDN